MASYDTFLDFFYNITISQAVVATVFLLLFVYYNCCKYRGIPPGPRGIPILGYWPFLKEVNANTQVEQLKERYGEIYSFTAAGQLYINLCSFKVIKEAHLSKSDCFMDRFTGYSLLTVSFEDAVSIINGESWKVQRKFYQQKFKEYGMLAIKQDFSGSVYDTLKETVEEIRALEGKPFHITELLTVKCSLIIRRILFHDQGITEEELKELNQAYEAVLMSMTHKNMILMGNIARYLVFPFISSYWAFCRSHSQIQDILGKVIKRHKDNFDETQILDIIDSYYKEKKDRETKGDPTAKYFTDKALLSNVYQFVTDGVLTIAFFIGMAIEKLVQYPDEQDKIHEELINALGPDRQPTMDDRGKLPYTNAFIYEVIRFSESLPMVPSLKCTKETIIQGYRIPKGAVTLINVWCANHDPEVYDEPYEFKPSRFVTAPGKPKPELPFLFGIGKRNCLGEPFTMLEAFLFVATLVKNFHLSTPEKTSHSMLTVSGIEICANPRNQEQDK